MNEAGLGDAPAGPDGLTGWLNVVLFYLLLKICIDALAAWNVAENLIQTANFSVYDFRLLFAAFPVFLILITLKTLSLFIKKSSDFPDAFRNFLLLHISFGLMTSFLLYSGDAPIEKTVPPTLRELIAFWIGSAYLNKSTRVAATFTR